MANEHKPRSPEGEDLRERQTRREAGAQNLGALLGEVAGLPNRGRGSFGHFPRGKEGERMRPRSSSTR
jgi:hypothetical protein